MRLRKLLKKNTNEDNSSNTEEINNSSDTQVQLISSFLEGIKITIIGGGGIAATELPKLSRELRRHGADIHFCVTENCLKFIGIESLRWASNNEVIINPTGLAEHICTSDALVISPATADLISKSSNGICSDGASTLIQSALGMEKTIIFCSTMHESLAFSPIIKKNKSKLKKINNVFFTEPRIEEGKEKLPLPDILSINIAHIINKRRLYAKNEKKVLITLGGSRAMLDPVRCITNLSTGSLGIEVAKTFYAMGIELTLLCANTNKPVPIYEYEKIISLPNYQEMYSYLKNINEKEFHGIFHLLAGSDFIPKNRENSKISSKNDTLNIDLIKTEKIINLENLNNIPFKAAAKLTSGDNLLGLNVAKDMLIKKHLNAVIYSNTSSVWGKNSEHSGTFLENKNGQILEISVNSKRSIAHHFYLAFKNFFQCKTK